MSAVMDIRHGGVRNVVHDAMLVTQRNLIRYVRIPTLVVFSTIQPVMFVLLFTYVFGGSITIPGYAHYRDFLMPGIFVQTTVFGSTSTGIGLAEDLSKGMIDRFRSLPMARSAVLAGRTGSDAIRNLFVVLLMFGIGTAIGFRADNGLYGAIAAVALTISFGYAFSWISAAIGLAIRDVESTQAASFVWLFPLTFASTAFSAVQNMPGWLQGWVKVNPVSFTVDAERGLLHKDFHSALTHPLFFSLVWIVGILLVFSTISVRKYRQVA